MGFKFQKVSNFESIPIMKPFVIHIFLANQTNQQQEEGFVILQQTGAACAEKLLYVMMYAIHFCL